LVALGVDELYAANAIERRSSAGEPFNMKCPLARRFHPARSASRLHEFLIQITSGHQRIA
jgi:hypothetical protein